MTDPQLRMLRPDLENLPGLDLPDGYNVRSYQPGDDKAWEHIIDQSFGAKPGSHSFDSIMRKDPAFRPERIWFIVQDRQPVATASAYSQPEKMPNSGMIHYVGALDGHKGKKLGFLVTLAALHQMVREDWQSSWLSTDDFRLPAIKTYLNLGFEPMLIHENQRERWRKVFDDLGLPDLKERFAATLDGEVWQDPAMPQDNS